MECPKCQIEIGNAKYCGCGWKSKTNDEQPMPFIPCAYMACQNRAILREKVTTTAWANFCLFHYEERGRLKAEETCHRLGLKTVAEKRAWVLNAVRGLADKWKPSYLKEPDPDDPIP